MNDSPPPATLADPPAAGPRSLIRGSRFDTLLISLLALAAAALVLTVPLAALVLVDDFARGTTPPVGPLAAAAGGCLVLAALARAVQRYLAECVGRRAALTTVVGGTTPAAVAAVLSERSNAAAGLLVGAAALALVHPSLAAVGAGLAAVGLLTAFAPGGRAARRAEATAAVDAANWRTDAERAADAFRPAAGPRFAREKADALARAWLHARRDRFRAAFRREVFSWLALAIAGGAVLSLGGTLVADGRLTPGGFVAAGLVTMLMGTALRAAGRARGAWDELASCPVPAHRADERAGTELPPTAGGRGVSARAAVCEPGLPLPLTWHVRPGSRVALLGPSGGGKSTLLDLFAGRHAPTSGSVELDGVDLRELAPHALREAVVLVRGPAVFAGTVADNLRAGRADAGSAEFTRVLTAVGLKDAVARLPDGTRTPLESGGRPLSDGQAARLTLARAMLARPRVLLLDGVLDRLNHADGPGLLAELFDRAAPWTLVVVSTDPRVLVRCEASLKLAPGQPPVESTPAKGPPPTAPANGAGGPRAG